MLCTLFNLLFDVMKQSYFSEEFKENVGYMLVTITDPRIKEELYHSMRVSYNKIVNGREEAY